MSSSEDEENFTAPLPAGSTYAAQAANSLDPAIASGAKRAVEVEEEEEDVDNVEPDDDDDEEEDEEDEDDDDDDDDRRERRRPKKRKLNRFLDVEAVVDDEDEEEDEEGEYAAAENDFIENDRLSPDYAREQGRHRLLDMEREGQGERSAQEMAAALDQRYKRNTKYRGESSYGPSKANMPTPQDPKLWRISCKGGKEKDIIRTILQKSFAMEAMGEDMGITAAFQRDTIRETIYVEARQPQDVQKALTGISGVYLNSRPRAGPAMPGRDHIGKGPMIVPREDMVPLLTMQKKEVEAKEGMWVRVKRGKYSGDLGQIQTIVQDGLLAVIALVPRIDYNPTDRNEDRKRKKAGFQSAASVIRPPQRLFDADAVQREYGRGAVSKRQGLIIFQNEDYNPDTRLLEKEYPLTSLDLEDVKPTLDEISIFPEADATGESAGVHIDLRDIADAAKKSAISNIQPGDQVEVQEGEQTGMRGVVESLRGETVTIRTARLVGDEYETGMSTIEVPVKSIRKTFKPGDHVKVMSGKNIDETGLVLDVTQEIVTIWSDLSQREIKVFARDVREAAEVGAGANRVGQYELHDLVLIDPQTAGVIFQTERDGFKILDQNGGVRSLLVHQISGKPDQRGKADGLDKSDRTFHIGDQMKEVEGEQRKGQVLQIHRGIYCWLHSREITENQGVFVVRCNNLGSVDPRSDASGSAALDLTRMNPALSQPTAKSGIMTANLRHLINTRVVITKGTQKGLIGMIKDMNGEKARIELIASNRVVDQPIANLKRKDENGMSFPLDLTRGGRQPAPGGPPGMMGPPTSVIPSQQNPYMNAGGATPAAGLAYGMTPNPYANAAGGRTPAPNFGQTPNPYANAGGRTPAFGMGGATPAGALGGRTPAAALGGATPYSSYGGSTTSFEYGSAAANPYSNPGTGSRYGGGNSAYASNPYTPSSNKGGASSIAYTPTTGPGFLEKMGGGTENPYLGATPSGYGTPSNEAGRNGSAPALNENWSQDLLHILVTIGPSSSTSRDSSTPLVFENNLHANDTFIVTYHSPSYVRPLTARVQSTTRRDEVGKPVEFPIAIQYLQPVTPSRGQTGEEVIVLVGDMRGQRGRTLEQDRDTGMWTISANSSRSIRGEHLCRVAL